MKRQCVEMRARSTKKKRQIHAKFLHTGREPQNRLSFVEDVEGVEGVDEESFGVLNASYDQLQGQIRALRLDVEKVEHTTLSLASSIVSQGLQFYVPESSTTVVVVRREKLSVVRAMHRNENGNSRKGV